MFEKLTGERRGATPSLNALRAFEAVGRTGKVVLAAEELCVTHGAVSRQVKALEASLGVRLFEGPKHRLTLTETGRELLPTLTRALDDIASATLRAAGGERELRFAVNASISVKWLIPRLGRFTARHPEIEVSLIELAPHAHSHRGAHALVRIVDREAYPGIEATAFAENHIGPVLSPALAAMVGTDLPSAPRLVAQTHLRGWARWAALAGVDLPPAPERALAHLHFVLDGAVAGLGAAILPWPLVAEEVEAGRLVAPLGFIRVPAEFGLIATPGAGSRSLDRFRAWLVEEGARTPSAPGTRTPPTIPLQASAPAH
jgi:LysR family glycine cleavage system transcriptional activator